MWLMAYSLKECIYFLRCEISLYNLVAFKPFEMYKSVFYVVFVTSLYSDGYKAGFKRCLIGFLKGVS